MNVKILLDNIREDFLPYLKEKNLDRLIDFIYGYDSCMEQLTGKTYFDFSYFTTYVEDFYGIETTAYRNWPRIIKFFSNSQEDAVDKFIELYNNYLAGNYKEFYEKKQKEEFERITANGGSVEVVHSKTEKREPLPFPDEQLYLFRKRPGYFGRKSFSKMMDFFDGYLYCLKEQTGKEQELLPEFQEYVEKCYKTKKNSRFNHHWSKLIEFFTPDFSGEEAFDEFFKLYDGFRKKQNQKKK